MPFLLKSEPDSYSFDDLVRDGETVWDGIKNAQALHTLAAMHKGEKLVIYHSGTGKEAVGIASVVSVDASDPKQPLVRIKAGKRLKEPRTLQAMREAPVFHDSGALPPVPPVRRAAHRRAVRLAAARLEPDYRCRSSRRRAISRTRIR